MTDIGPGAVPGQLVGSVDPVTGDAELVGWIAGPAGVAPVDLAGGRVLVAFDHTEPHLVASVRVEGPHDLPQVAAAMDALLGGLWATVRARLADRPRIVWAAHEHGDGGADGTVDRLGRFAVLLAEHRERPARPAAAAVRALELAAAAADLPTGLGLSPSPDDLWGRAVDAVRAVAVDDLLDTVPHHLRPVVAGWVEQAGGVTGDDGTLAALVHALRRPGRDVAAAALADLRPPAAAPLALRSAPPSPQPAPAGEAVRPGTPIAVQLDPALGLTLDRGVRTAGHVEVAVRGALDGPRWLRVLQAPRGPLEPPLLVALAHLRSTPFGPAWAAALLPEHLDGADGAGLLVDVVADATAAWRPAPVRATARGIRAGRDAVHAGRTAGPEQARPAWQRSAEAHEQAGDKRRSALARSYADGDGARGRGRWGTDPRRRRATEPYVSDDAL